MMLGKEVEVEGKTSASSRIAVGIITFRRPQMLEELLKSIILQTILQYHEVSLEIVLVDNDPNGDAKSIFNKFSQEINCSTYYYCEPNPSIPLARNRVLQHAHEFNFDYIAFIDDDEVASRDWLENLYKVLSSTGGDGVQGPVLNRLPDNAPAWAKKIYSHERCFKKNEGARKDILSTNNVLFSVRLISDLGLRFDETYTKSGGSDADLFLRASLLGSKHIWTNTALVYEIVPNSRLTMKWQLQRAFRVGAGNTFMYIRQCGVLAGIKRYWLKILLRIMLGLCVLATAGVFSELYRIKAIRSIASGLGHFTGFWGIRGQEYSRVHGQ